jgi:hypothetical protein
MWELGGIHGTEAAAESYTLIHRKRQTETGKEKREGEGGEEGEGERGRGRGREGLAWVLKSQSPPSVTHFLQQDLILLIQTPW